MRTEVKFTGQLTNEWLADYLLCLEINQFKSAIFFVASDSYQVITESISLLNRSPINIAGAIFPEIIYDKKPHQEGVIAISIEKEIDVIEIEDSGCSTLPNSFYSLAKSSLVLLNTMNPKAEKHLDFINSLIDPNKPIVGMGSGLPNLQNQATIFNGSGLLNDSSLLILHDFEITQKTDHGYTICKGPFLVTKSSGNIIEELNYQNAYEVYNDVIQHLKNSDLKLDNFKEWSKGYPLGIENMDGSVLLRDTTSSDGKYLTTVGSMPENSVVHIMHCSKDTLIEASNKASEVANELYLGRSKQSNQPTLALLTICHTRKDILGDRFEEEINCISTIPAIDHCGVVSLGEISNYHSANATLLNNSVVVTLM